MFWSNRNADGGCRDDFLAWRGEILRIVAIYRVLRVLVSDATAFYTCELAVGGHSVGRCEHASYGL